MAGPADQVLLEQAVSRLRDTGEIAYRGEFGNEIATFIPFVGWLKRQGLLAGRRVLTYAGMRPYYYFLDDDEYAERASARTWLPPQERDWPSASSYTAVRERWHVMPDYRTQYWPQQRAAARPLLFIQNKFCVEWSRGPVNYVPLEALDRLFRLAGKRFDIVYSRPRHMAGQAGYAVDDNSDCDFPDRALALRYRDVMLFEEHVARNSLDYNRAKLAMLAKCHLFVAAQGGGAHLLACFGDSLMLVMHREGEEYPHAYAKGPYKYLASPPPVLMVAREHEAFMRGIELIANVRFEGKDMRVPGAFAATLAELRM